jgi:hypothetical protein
MAIPSSEFPKYDPDKERANEIFEEMKLGKKQADLGTGRVGDLVREQWAAHLALQREASAKAITEVPTVERSTQGQAQEREEEVFRRILADRQMRAWVAVLTGRSFEDRDLVASVDVEELKSRFPTRSSFLGEQPGDMARSFLKSMTARGGNEADHERKRDEYRKKLGTLADLLYGEVAPRQRPGRFEVTL